MSVCNRDLHEELIPENMKRGEVESLLHLSPFPAFISSFVQISAM